MTAALPMGGQKITGMADPTVVTDGATKNYVDTTTATFFSTGDVKLTFKTTPDSGWLIFNDNTFGSGASGATVASNTTLALFTLFFNNLSDTAAALFTSGGGATTRAAQVSASAAWAANCRMLLPYTLGRALGIAGAASGLTARALGSIVGQETATLAPTNLPPYTPAGTVTSPVLPIYNNTVNPAGGSNVFTSVEAANSNNTFQGFQTFTGSSGATFTGTAAPGQISTPVAIMQPTVFLNAMVKL